MKTIIHQYHLNSEVHVGGIDTWISDYLEFSTSKVRVLGVSDDREIISHRHELFSIMQKKSKVKIPVSLSFSLHVLMHRKLISQEILVHRIDYVPILRMIRPRADITLFIHTDSLQQTGSSSDSYWRFIPQLYFAYEKIALFLSSRVYVYSETDFKRIQTIKASACQLKAWYNDSVFRNLGIPRNSKRILWVGRFEQPKDPLLAIRSFAEALEIDSSLNLHLIGDGSLKQAMTHEIVILGLSDRVKIVDPMNQRELALEMNKAGTLLHTSEFEGSPRILLEALACGLRLVSNLSADPDKLSVLFGNCSQSRLPCDVAAALLQVQRRNQAGLELKEFLSKVAGSTVVAKDFV